LTAKENGAVLTHQNWYTVTAATGFDVHMGTVDLCALQGDPDGDCEVLSFDYFEVKNNMFYHPVHMWDDCSATPPMTVNCGRADMDGDGQILAFDYFVVKNHMFDQCPPKP
jgi:hypothetical protein